jgi:hypothetical protein
VLQPGVVLGRAADRHPTGAAQQLGDGAFDHRPISPICRVDTQTGQNGPVSVSRNHVHRLGTDRSSSDARVRIAVPSVLHQRRTPDEDDS